MTTIVEKDQAIIKDFKALESWEDRYKRIIDIGRNSAGLPADKQIDDLKVKGCQSQVWISTELKDGKIIYKADSDALIVKGLVCLLCDLFSDESPDAILDHQPQFVNEIGLTNHLSPSRTNGLFNMLKQIKFYALAYQASSKLE